jgi:hypothetical protein
MAAVLEEKAQRCDPSDQTSYRALAEGWRHVARQAKWQDAVIARLR